MKILVVGGGGREHAVVEKLKQSEGVSQICVCPGNGGMKDVLTVDISATDIDGIAEFCLKYRPSFVVVTPDDPLALGLVDKLTALGFACFGPTQKAAEIESSKVFAKNLMKKYGIPTAKYQVFNDLSAAESYLKVCDMPVVVKADGLALGKGVTVAKDRQSALDAAKAVLQDGKFGENNRTIVVEEFLEGVEVSVLAFVDGKTVVPMVSSMDHKRALDGDLGANTGGMGTIAPNPYFTQQQAELCKNQIFLPTVEALQKEGREFRGCLYFGLMLTKDGPKVIEYNCRFGDPETQVVLPLLKSDLLKIFRKTAEGNLSENDVEFFDDKAACCVIAASQGYPASYQKGLPLTVPATDNKTEFVFCAGVKKNADGSLATNGGRVVGATAVASTLKEAVAKAYALADKIEFSNKYMRMDIGKKALSALNRSKT